MSQPQGSAWRLSHPEGLRNSLEVEAALAETSVPDMRLLMIAGDPAPEVGSWYYDYSEQTIRTRWQAGATKARDALQSLVSATAPQPRKTAS